MYNIDFAGTSFAGTGGVQGVFHACNMLNKKLQMEEKKFK